jgi:hypothetical protein
MTAKKVVGVRKDNDCKLKDVGPSNWANNSLDDINTAFFNVCKYDLILCYTNFFKEMIDNASGMFDCSLDAISNSISLDAISSTSESKKRKTKIPSCELYPLEIKCINDIGRESCENNDTDTNSKRVNVQWNNILPSIYDSMKMISNNHSSIGSMDSINASLTSSADIENIKYDSLVTNPDDMGYKSDVTGLMSNSSSDYPEFRGNISHHENFCFENYYQI